MAHGQGHHPHNPEESILREIRDILRDIRALLQNQSNRVLGGVMSQIGDPMQPIQPGNSPEFQVSPTFTGASFTTVAAQASVSSSDPDNFPVALDPTDPTGLKFIAAIPSTAQPVGGSEAITVTWQYTNTDGTVATVTGTVTEQGITDDVTGGTFAQIS